MMLKDFVSGTSGSTCHQDLDCIEAVITQVKLVGPYLSCEIEIHLQGPFLVTDRYMVVHTLLSQIVCSVCLCSICSLQSPHPSLQHICLQCLCLQ